MSLPASPLNKDPVALGHPPSANAWSSAVTAMAASRSGRVGIALALLLVLFATLGPWAIASDPLRLDLSSRHQGMSWVHPFGTDHLGRDMLARTAWGARLSLGVACTVTLAAVAMGTLVGLLAAWFGGLVDSLLMRLVDVVLAVPGLLLALALAGVFGAGIIQAMLAIVLTAWAAPARLVRSQALVVRRRPAIEASRAGGARNASIVWRHLLPGVASTLTVVATLEAAGAVLALGALSFLGLGSAPPAPEWGRMLLEAKPYLTEHPLQMLAPGLALAWAVLAFQLMGDGLRDTLDPRAHRSAD
jgi:peptide/nickel transport system permease protein